MNTLLRLLNQIKEFFKNLSPARKISFILVLGLVIAGLVALILWGQHVDYRVLFRELSPEDASAVVQALKEQNTPYRLEANGTSVSVPSDIFYDARLSLASKGLPEGGAVGFELFDEPKLGMSEYVQRLNYRRALQGELARTISRIDEVKSARVHIAIPEQALFEENQLPTTASVVLRLERSARLNRGQVQGIVHLVSHSVEGLDKENVTVMDSSGNMLFAGAEARPGGLLSIEHQEMKNQIETTLQRKIKSILEKTVGEEKVRVQVDATVDPSETTETKEIFDPERTAIRSEQSQREESYGTRDTSEGVPGVKPNVRGDAGEASNSPGLTHKRSSETFNYEISRTFQNNFYPGGEIKRLSVAVLVDGSYVQKPGQTGPEALEYLPRTSEEMAKYKSIVEKVIGYDELRGDKVTVVNLPFERPEDEAERLLMDAERRRFWSPFIRYGIMLALVVLVLLFVVRPLFRYLIGTAPPPTREALLTEEERIRITMREEKARIEAAAEEDVILKFQELARQSPEKMAQVIKMWLR